MAATPKPTNRTRAAKRATTDEPEDDAARHDDITDPGERARHVVPMAVVEPVAVGLVPFAHCVLQEGCFDQLNDASG